MPHLDALTRLFVTPWSAKSAPRISQDLEVRAMEERFGRAADIAAGREGVRRIDATEDPALHSASALRM